MQVKNKPKTSAASSVFLSRGYSSLRKTLAAFWKRKFLVLAAFVLVFAAICGCHYLINRHTASTILSLEYEEASRGLTPSQTRFNIFEIQSDEVMELLTEYAGLEGKITPDELRECVSVKATHDRNVSGGTNYISTSFVVKFTTRGAARQKPAEEMLDCLCRAYREYFVKHYGFNHSILSFDVDDLKFSDEYLLTADLLEIKCGQLQKYVQLRSRESKNYQDPDTGITFSALEQRANNFYAYDLAKLRSYIIENGIANDRAGLISMLDYKIRMDNLMHDKMMAAYDEDNKGIQMYDAAMSAAVMIPTQDQTMNYYMSRTKTGMDNMALHADEQLAGATERMEQIEYNTYLTQKLKTNGSTRMQKEKADDMIRAAQTSLEKLASDIQTVDSSYTSAKARNYLSFSEEGIPFADRIGLLPSILSAAAILCAAYVCVFLHRFLSGKKENEA
jgi:hypothetical protein